jgi:hypothetical protein
MTQNCVNLGDAVNITKKTGDFTYKGQFFENSSDDYLASEDTISHMTAVLRLFLHNCT